MYKKKDLTVKMFSLYVPSFEIFYFPIFFYFNFGYLQKKNAFLFFKFFYRLNDYKKNLSKTLITNLLI